MEKLTDLIASGMFVQIIAAANASVLLAFGTENGRMVQFILIVWVNAKQMAAIRALAADQFNIFPKIAGERTFEGRQKEIVEARSVEIA
jgi:hypothetical protein